MVFDDRTPVIKDEGATETVVVGGQRGQAKKAERCERPGTPRPRRKCGLPLGAPAHQSRSLLLIPTKHRGWNRVCYRHPCWEGRSRVVSPWRRSRARPPHGAGAFSERSRGTGRTLRGLDSHLLVDRAGQRPAGAAAEAPLTPTGEGSHPSSHSLWRMVSAIT